MHTTILRPVASRHRSRHRIRHRIRRTTILRPVGSELGSELGTGLGSGLGSGLTIRKALGRCRRKRTITPRPVDGRLKSCLAISAKRSRNWGRSRSRRRSRRTSILRAVGSGLGLASSKNLSRCQGMFTIILHPVGLCSRLFLRLARHLCSTVTASTTRCRACLLLVRLFTFRQR